MAEAEPRWYDPQDTTAEGLLRDVAAGAAEHVVVNSPHNPTGVEYPQEVIDALAAAARAAGVRVISDEVYRCFAAQGGSFLPHVSPGRGEVVVVDGLSKTAGAAGLRVGFLVAGRATIDDATMVRGTVDSCPSGIGQACALFLLSEAARRFREGVRALAHTTVRGLAARLAAEGLPVASAGAMYVWVPSAADGSVPLAGRVLRGAPGAGFGAAGYARLCPVTDDARCAELLATHLSVPGLAA
jgi:aspartate/methionine/tyrosine aminotransferase